MNIFNQVINLHDLFKRTKSQFTYILELQIPFSTF